MSASIRILLADDQPLVRSGFRMVLERREGLEVVGEATDGDEAVSLARSLRADVVVMDVRMPRCDGIEATRRLTSGDAAWRPRVIMLTTFDLDEYVFEALRAGAAGFLLKDCTADELVQAVRVVAAGDSLLAPTVTRRLIEQFARSPSEAATSRSSDTSKIDAAAIAALTNREREVLALVAKGMSNQEIADALVVSEPTVKSHVAHMLAKLGLRDRVQAVVFAYDHDLRGVA